MTREIYTHVTDTMLQEAADTIERAVGGTDADADVNGSNSGSSEGNDPRNDEGQEPEDGA